MKNIFAVIAIMTLCEVAGAQQTNPAQGMTLMQACLDREAQAAPAATADEIRQTCERKQQELEAKAAEFEKRMAEDPTFAKSKAGKVCKKHPGWSRQVCADVAAHNVRIGMTKDQAQAAWGKPVRINTTVNASGVHEQWVHRVYLPFATTLNNYQYLYFTNGILTSYQLVQ